MYLTSLRKLSCFVESTNTFETILLCTNIGLVFNLTLSLKICFFPSKSFLNEIDMIKYVGRNEDPKLNLSRRP